MDKTLIFNILWITGVLLIVVFNFRRDWRREKEDDLQNRAAASRVPAAIRKASKSYALQYVALPEDNHAFPDLDRDGFELADLAWYAIDDPPDAPLPTLSRKRHIAVGDLVRVGYVIEAEGVPKDVWVVVTDRPDKDNFVGEVVETHVPNLAGRRLIFHANHIGEVATPPGAGVPLS